MHNIPHVLLNRNQSEVNLQFMNIRDATRQIGVLSDFPYLEQLSLHGNRLKMIPCMEGLKSLTKLDISNNPININNHLIDSLYSLKNLNSLKIDCSQQQALYICEHLTKLRYLNGRDVIHERKEMLDQSYKKFSMEQIQKEWHDIKQLYHQLADVKNKNSNVSKGLSLSQKQLNQQIRNIIRQYTIFQQNVKNHKAKEAIKHYSKNKMLQAIDQVMIDLLSQGDIGQSDALELLVKINNKKKHNFQNILRTILQISYQECVDGQVFDEDCKFRKEKLYLHQISRMRKQITDLGKQINEIKALNQKYIEQIHNLVVKDQTKRKQNITPKGKQKENMVLSNSQVNFNKMIKTSQTNSTSNLKRQRQLNKNKSELSISKIHVKQPSPRFSIHQLNQQSLSFDKTLQLIDEIAKQKAIQNHQSFCKKEEFQTMEQFLFTFFFRKYGLKQIALNWSLTLINAIRQHSRKSGLVVCFGKILKNQIQQDFYHKQKKFQDKLKFHLGEMGAKRIKLFKVKHFSKQNLDDSSQISKPFKDFNMGQVNKLSINLFANNGEFRSKWLQQKIESCKYPISQGQLFKLFSEINLSFHEVKINKLMKLFRKYDKQDKGYLGRSQMLKLLKQYLQSAKQGNFDCFIDEPQRILSKMNPNQLNKILFSMYLKTMNQ